MSKTDIDIYLDDPKKYKIDNEKYKYDKINFRYVPQKDEYICPEGKKVVFNQITTSNKKTYKCNDCNDCSHKKECIGKQTIKRLYRNEKDKFVDENIKKISSDEWHEGYKKRMHTVEPVFGNIKYNLGFREFLLRGLEKVKGEFSIMCIAHNLKKIHKYISEKQNNNINFA